MNEFRVRRWTGEEFLAGREAWQQLLARSDADPLFMSWDWLAAGGATHAAPLGAELRVLAVYSPRRALRPRAVLSTSPRCIAAGCTARRLELLGNAWRDPDAVFRNISMSLPPATRVTRSARALAELVACEPEWDELACAICASRQCRRATRAVLHRSPLLASRGVHDWMEHHAARFVRSFRRPTVVEHAAQGAAPARQAGGFLVTGRAAQIRSARAARELVARRWHARPTSPDARRFPCRAGRGLRRTGPCASLNCEPAENRSR